MALRTIRDLAIVIAAIAFTAQTIESSYAHGALGDAIWYFAGKN